MWKRIERGTTMVYVVFVYSVPLEAKVDILNHLDISINEDFRKPFLKRNNSTAGEFTLLHVDTLPKGSKGGLQAFCMKKGAGDRTAAAARMTQELDDFYEAGASYIYNCALETFMVDYDIKAFAEESLGMTWWEDSNEDWNNIFFSKTA
jgi:hypothetical protein